MRFQFGAGLFFCFVSVIFLLTGGAAEVFIPVLLAVGMFCGAFVQRAKLRREEAQSACP